MLSLLSALPGWEARNPPCLSGSPFLQQEESKGFDLFQGEGLLGDLWVLGP